VIRRVCLLVHSFLRSFVRDARFDFSKNICSLFMKFITDVQNLC